ncbi:MAG: SMC-Scp complex subunit ScpB [Gammaproteobacteria bacterium]|jgi:segregation and condensation protein B
MPITDEQLKQILEAAIMASTEPMSVDKMLALFAEEKEPPTRDAVKGALKVIEQECEARGVELKKVSSGYRFQAKKDMSPWVSRLWEEKPARYSRALLETLVLIAYKQPITRGEIEHVRGVAVSTNIIKTLLEREWVRVVGHRDVPGKPALYATTKAFLDYFNLTSLEELPTLAEIRDLDKINAELELEEPGAQTDENVAEGTEGAEGEGTDVSADLGTDERSAENTEQTQDTEIAAAVENTAAVETADTAELAGPEAEGDENTATEDAATENAVIQHDEPESDTINDVSEDSADRVAVPDEGFNQDLIAEMTDQARSLEFRGDEQATAPESGDRQPEPGVPELADVMDTETDDTLSPVDADYDDGSEDIDNNLDDRDVVVLDEPHHVALEAGSPDDDAFDTNDPVTTLDSGNFADQEIATQSEHAEAVQSPEQIDEQDIDEVDEVISSEDVIVDNESLATDEDFSPDAEIAAEADQDNSDEVYSVSNETDTDDAVVGTIDEQDNDSGMMSDTSDDDTSEVSEQQSKTPKAQAVLTDGDLNDDTGTLETATVDSDSEYSLADDDYDSRFGG